jgi:hypothetical protein
MEQRAWEDKSLIAAAAMKKYGKKRELTEQDPLVAHLLYWLGDYTDRRTSRRYWLVADKERKL